MARVRKPTITIPLTLAILAIASLASANQVTIKAEVDGMVPGDPRSDVQGPVTSGELLATVLLPEARSLDGLGPAFGRAAQNDAGVGSVEAEIKCIEHGVGVLTSKTTWTATATNSSNRLAEFVYQFYIEAPKLELLDPSNTSMEPAQASYEIVVKLNGQPIFSSSALLRGHRQGHTLTETGTDLGGSFFSVPGGNRYGYQFSPYQGILSLGFYPPGGSVTVESTLEVQARAVSLDAGSHAEVGDPLDLGGEPGLFSMLSVGEPLAVEPSSWGAVKELFRGN
jgi:hypothetical protein